ncbi:hypothetical protein [Sporosarcina sp. G11-34]|uniref:hypothetical protein n=1 Tax=Sporosarcina sp. G11-34 TaxID=2849605 RepID=UPI0022A98F6B|nr:hypothetical protein [Sporosarcina sp. G11-34]MCZ2260617.1 hypothetical protein [Sporosarcina sp. G11-34]
MAADIKKSSGNTPIIMNVTIETYGITNVNAAKKVGIFDDWHVVEVKREENKDGNIN